MKLFVVYYVPDNYGINPVCICASEPEAIYLCNKLKIDTNLNFDYYETELGKVDI